MESLKDKIITGDARLNVEILKEPTDLEKSMDKLGEIIYQKHSKHARFGPEKDSQGELRKWLTTKPKPWVIQKKKRAKAKAAKQARKANR